MQKYIIAEEWLSCLASKGRKDCTIENYRRKIGRCLGVLEDLGRPTDPRMITPGDMMLINKSLNLCENSRRDYLKVLNYLIIWLTGEDVLSKCDILWNHPEPDRLFISNDKFARLMEVSDARDRVILLLGGAMGLRRDEIRKLRYSDITEDGRLLIHGKGHGEGGKVEHMRIPPMVMEAIDEWTEIRNGNGLKDLSGGCIVVSYQKAGMKQMADTSLSHHVRKIGKEAGVRVTVHSLRRLFATSLYRSNVDLVDIKTLMRHSNIHTTLNCYILPDAERLDGIMDDMGMILNIQNDGNGNRHYEKRDNKWAWST